MVSLYHARSRAQMIIIRAIHQLKAAIAAISYAYNATGLSILNAPNAYHGHLLWSQLSSLIYATFHAHLAPIWKIQINVCSAMNYAYSAVDLLIGIAPPAP